MSETPIVFFDGVCNLCNGFIDFLMRQDRANRFRVASLQGQTAKSKLGGHLTQPPFKSVVLWDAGEVRLESDAILHIWAQLGWPWKALAAFRVLPPFVRDGVYKVIARYRYAWFGKKDTCRLPTPAEQAKFLD